MDIEEVAYYKIEMFGSKGGYQEDVERKYIKGMLEKKRCWKNDRK